MGWSYCRVRPKSPEAATAAYDKCSTLGPPMDPFSGMFLSREAVSSIIQFLRTPQVLNQVASNLELASKNQSLGSVTAFAVSGTEYFRLSVENTDAAVARDVANEVAQVTISEKETEWAGRIAGAEISLCRWSIYRS